MSPSLLTDWPNIPTDRRALPCRLLLTFDRWRKLLKAFYNEKKNLYDISKVPDIYDSAKYDAIHNAHLGLNLQDLYNVRPPPTPLPPTVSSTGCVHHPPLWPRTTGCSWRMPPGSWEGWLQEAVCVPSVTHASKLETQVLTGIPHDVCIACASSSVLSLRSIDLRCGSACGLLSRQPLASSSA